MRFRAADERFMRRALALARRGVGRTSPNPAVGAVVVRGRRIVGEGYHHRAGGPHAEIEALHAAKSEERREKNDRRRGSLAPITGHRSPLTTLYVTLEPCCTWGRTPPCTDAIIAAGVRRVVVAARDPNPRHDGRGLRILRRAGLRVAAGLLADEAARLNEAFNRWIVTGRPLVIAKAALSLDGKIATRTGDSKWITGAAARREAHRLRSRVDAVMVGAGTVRADDPRLTVRHGVRGRQPWRVVVDARGRCSRGARVFTDRWRARTVVVTTTLAPARWRRALAARGVRVLVVNGRAGQVDLRAALRELGRLPVTSVLVEGGGELLGSLFAQRLVDRVVFCYAPLVIGGRAAVTAVAGPGVARVAGAIRVGDALWRRLRDGTLVLTARVKR